MAVDFRHGGSRGRVYRRSSQLSSRAKNEIEEAHMIKKLFALASVTTLVGLVATVTAAGCSSTPTEPVDGGASDAAKDAKKDVTIEEEPDAAGPPEEKTVGKLCEKTEDCNVPDSKNDNTCAKGLPIGDVYGSPVCVQPKCTQGPGNTFGDFLCDGQTGVCLPSAVGSRDGICLPACAFDSKSIGDTCQGTNKCRIRYTGTTADKSTLALGSCEGACQADTDCKSAGQKCQVELGICVVTAKYLTYPVALGAGCDGAKTPTPCVCSTVGGAGADKNKGICTRQCITGAAGNAACAAAVPGWACTAELETKDDKGVPAFTAQVDDILGNCALPCVDDTTCAPLQTSTTTPMKCVDFAGGKFCSPKAP